MGPEPLSKAIVESTSWKLPGQERCSLLLSQRVAIWPRSSIWRRHRGVPNHSGRCWSLWARQNWRSCDIFQPIMGTHIPAVVSTSGANKRWLSQLETFVSFGDFPWLCLRTPEGIPIHIPLVSHWDSNIIAHYIYYIIIPHEADALLCYVGCKLVANGCSLAWVEGQGTLGTGLCFLVWTEVPFDNNGTIIGHHGTN